MGVVVMGVVVTGCPKKNPYDSQLPKSPPKTYHWIGLLHSEERDHHGRGPMFY